MRKISSTVVCILLAVMLIASCSDRSTQPTGSVAIRAENPYDSKAITPDGATSVTHYSFRLWDEAGRYEYTSGYVKEDGEFIASDLFPGRWYVSAEAYVKRDTEGYVRIAESSAVEVSVKAGETQPVTVSFDALSEAVSGDITITLRLSSEDFPAGSTVYAVWGIDEKPSDSSWANASSLTIQDNGTARLLIDAEAEGIQQGFHILYVSIADSADPASQSIIRKGADAMRLLPGVPASGSISFASYSFADGMDLSITDSIGNIITATTDKGSELYEIETGDDGTGSITVSFGEAIGNGIEVEWYADGELIEDVSEGSSGSYTLTLPSGAYRVIAILRDPSTLASVGSTPSFGLWIKDMEITEKVPVTVESYFDMLEKIEIPSGYFNAGFIPLWEDPDDYSYGTVIFPYETTGPDKPYDELTPEDVGLHPVNKRISSAFSYSSYSKSITRGSYDGYYLAFRDGDVTTISGVISFPVNGYYADSFPVLYLYSEENSTRLRGLYLPDSVTRIGDAAFALCQDLRELRLSENLEYIGINAFIGMTSLEGDLVIPDSVTYIGQSAFNSCGTDGRLILGNSIETLEYAAFSSSSFTGELVIPASIKTFSECYHHGNVTTGGFYRGSGGQFENCPGFTSIIFPEGIEIIPDYIFRDCTGLSGTLYIPDTVKEIGVAAFASSGYEYVIITDTLEVLGGFGGGFRGASGLDGCPNLKGVATTEELAHQGVLEIPDSVREIGVSAFSDIDSFIRIDFGDSIEIIGDSAFNSYSADISIGSDRLVFPSTLKEIGSQAFMGVEIGELVLNEGLEEIGNRAFEGASLSGEIVIPSTLTDLGINAFYYAGITNVSFTEGSALEEIGEKAFYGNDDLVAEIGESVRTIGPAVFDGSDVAVYVPSSVTEMTVGDGYNGKPDYPFMLDGNSSIYCEAPAKPDTWPEEWHSESVSVMWGVPVEDFRLVTEGITPECNIIIEVQDGTLTITDDSDWGIVYYATGGMDPSLGVEYSSPVELPAGTRMVSAAVYFGNGIWSSAVTEEIV